MAPSTPSPNVLPDWWSFVFMGLQLASLLPLVYQNLFDPITTFKRVLPPGYDAATDGIKRSLRVEMAMMNSAQAYPMILILFLGITLFARNSLSGQPGLQQEVMRLPIAAGLLSDAWLVSTLVLKLPPQVLWHTSAWTPPIKGIALGIPFATTWKLLWLAGVGRDVV